MTSHIHHLKLDSNATVQLKINLKIKYQSQEKKLCKKKKKNPTYIKTLPGIGLNYNLLTVTQQNHLPWGYHYMPIIKCNHVNYLHSRLKSQTINIIVFPYF